MSLGVLEKKLEVCLTQENRLFHMFGLLEEQLISLLQQKQWPEVDDFVNRLKALAVEIEQVEENRCKTFAAVCKEVGHREETTLGTILASLEPEFRVNLSALQRQLKESVTKVRSLSNGMLMYSKYMRNTIDDILKEIFPHRKGKIYSQQGKAHVVHEEPVVLNKQF
jgi:hypothetical protein